MMPADMASLNVSVTAAARRTGVGAALFDRTAGTVPAGTHRLLGFSDDRDDDVVLPWLAARAFRPFQHSIHSSLDLRSRPVVPDTTDRSGLSVELVDAFSTADDASVAQLYGASDTSPESRQIGALTWQQQLEGARSFGTEALLVLVRDEESRPVAMTLAQHAEARRWSVRYTGVHPQARGRAIGRFAKAALHDVLADRGVDEVDTDNEASNTGIRHVNEQLGYRREKGVRRHARDLTADPLP
jgi:GNAT superfamily N-acetyltransferase